MSQQTAAVLNLIANQSVPAASQATFSRVNPAAPHVELGPYPDSAQADIEAAVAAACATAPAWAAQTHASRAEVLFRAADLVEARTADIARNMSLETGKPLTEAIAETRRCAQVFRYFAGEAWRELGQVFQHSGTGGQAIAVRRPVGVMGLITPWNFPAAIPAWKLGPALVFGNTVVIKVSEDSPASSLGIVACLVDAGLPEGVLNAVVGRGPTAGESLTAHPSVDAISFTGSVAVGHRVRDAAITSNKAVQLELGGHNPLIVAADAELDRAVEAAFAGAFFSAGQKCTATRRILIHQDCYADFRARLLDRVKAGVVGDPMDLATEVGPVVNERAYTAILSAIERGQAEGATMLTGGAGDRPGFYIQPTVFEDVDEQAELSREEVFGPVTSLYRYRDLDQAIEFANATAYGLSAAIFTSSIKTARHFSGSIQAGVIHVNSQTPGAEVHLPFGGMKNSGWGPPEQGRSARDFYTREVTIYEDV
jgi:aldehyde dehydrogenase (NAD+)